MALTISTSNGTGGGARIFYGDPTRHLPLLRRHVLFPLSARRSLHIVSAKKFRRRTDPSSKNRRGSITTTRPGPEIETEDVGAETVGVSVKDANDDFVLPELPGEKPDFWEGPQWDTLGFVVEYLWAIGLGFAAIACAVAVVTYNEGATDFKDTAAYKESVQSRDLLEGPDSSNSDVFESNPTEVAPSLE